MLGCAYQIFVAEREIIFEGIFTVCVFVTLLCVVYLCCASLFWFSVMNETTEVWKVFNVNKLYDISRLSSSNNCSADSHLTCFSMKIGLHLNLFLEAFI